MKRNLEFIKTNVENLIFLNTRSITGTLHEGLSVFMNKFR